MKLNSEMNDIKNEEIVHLRKEIDNMKDNGAKLKNDNIQLKNDINQLRNENAQLKKELNELKEKLNKLWKERNENKLIFNSASKIINGKDKYSDCLKYWINPLKKIKAELLYRLSENGDNKSTFHKLCDNKGPTLTLFHVNDGNIVGIYTPLSWDSTTGWKKDMDTSIFNLNKKQKHKKLKENDSIYCNSFVGPWTSDFGCENSMKSLLHDAYYSNKFYDKGTEILPSNNEIKVYKLIETEVYKIIIE